MAEIAEGWRDEPEQPEALAILRRLRRFNLTYWRGGYADQPHILMREFNTVIDAEIEHKTLLAKNKALAKPPSAG